MMLKVIVDGSGESRAATRCPGSCRRAPGFFHLMRQDEEASAFGVMKIAVRAPLGENITHFLGDSGCITDFLFLKYVTLLGHCLQKGPWSFLQPMKTRWNLQGWLRPHLLQACAVLQCCFARLCTQPAYQEATCMLPSSLYSYVYV